MVSPALPKGRGITSGRQVFGGECSEVTGTRENLSVRAVGGKMSPGVHLAVASCALMHPSLLLVARLRGGTANE